MKCIILTKYKTSVTPKMELHLFCILLKYSVVLKIIILSGRFVGGWLPTYVIVMWNSFFIG
jgi:hypothetical protein